MAVSSLRGDLPVGVGSPAESDFSTELIMLGHLLFRGKLVQGSIADAVHQAYGSQPSTEMETPSQLDEPGCLHPALTEDVDILGLRNRYPATGGQRVRYACNMTGPQAVKPSPTLSMEIPTRPGQEYSVASRIRHFSRVHGYGCVEAGRISTAVLEGGLNAIEHSFDLDYGVKVRLSVGDMSMEIVVENHGIPFDLSGGLGQTCGPGSVVCRGAVGGFRL